MQAGVGVLVKDAGRAALGAVVVKRIEAGMQEVQVGGIDVAFEGLEPIALAHEWRHVAMRRRDVRPLQPREGWWLGPRAHVGPDRSPLLKTGIGGLANALLEGALW